MGIVSRQESINVRDDKSTPNYSNGNYVCSIIDLSADCLFTFYL